MKKTINLLFAAALTCSPLASMAQQSATWNPNLPGGKYRNPVINADYSDPDACRVGDDYYMTSSRVACFPGLKILHSTDIDNWKIKGADNQEDYHELPELKENKND